MQKPRIMLVGSGALAANCNEFNLADFVVAAINHAWSVPKKLDVHIYAGDWLPRGMPYTVPGDHREISYRDYDSPRQHARFGRQEVGIGATMFFNAAYWCLGELDPAEMYFSGCSMDYPSGDANTFYGCGTADPLRFGPQPLNTWFKLFQDAAAARGVKLINIGSHTGLMPW